MTLYGFCDEEGCGRVLIWDPVDRRWLHTEDDSPVVEMAGFFVHAAGRTEQALRDAIGHPMLNQDTSNERNPR